MSKTFIAAALAITAIAAPAFAADAPAKSITTAGVDFQSQAQVEGFYTKLAITAAQVCDSNSANSVVTQDDKACAKRVLADAVARLAQPTLTAHYRNVQAQGVNLASR